MRLPISWLKDYVEFDATPDELARRLTFSGIEVEGIETIGSDFAGVIVGEILEIQAHPQADRLRVCSVNDGQKIRTVVCGAENYNVGDKAALAPTGVKLPGGQEIRETKIRGVLSEGMLCAEDELGISADHTGILLVSRDVPAGTPLAKVMGPPETVLQLEITWNRPDSLSILGIAREVSALFGVPMHLPPTEIAEEGPDIGGLVDVVIEDRQGCPRYTARVLSRVKIGPSPLWMQKRLTLCGVRPISNVVDVTNYVMLECGQPLHAFDYRRVEDHTIVVRRAAASETMATLDGVERGIGAAGALVIADRRRPLAVAGVMGGAGSEIHESTDTVLLESACFDPADVRRTSCRLGLSTESSHRYERGVDVGGAEWASRRAARLMAEVAGATIAKGARDIFPGRPEERRASCRFQKTRELLGIEISDDRIVSILNSLQIPVVERQDDRCVVAVPTFRRDIEIEADLIEEIARIQGLDDVPEAIPQCRIVSNVEDLSTRVVLACRAQLIGLGLTEIMNYSFLSERLLNVLGGGDPKARVVLPNPVSVDLAIMRNSLMPQMVETLGRNLSRQVDEAAFFEIGRVFLRDPKGGVSEEDRLSLGLMGKVGRVGLEKRRPLEPLESFLWLKGIVEALCLSQHAGEVVFLPTEHAGLEKGTAVSVVVRGEPCGVLGLVHQLARSEWRMNEPVAIGEFALERLTSQMFSAPKIDSLPTFPSISRDVAMIVAERATHEDIMGVIRRSAPPELTNIELFDIFQGKAIGAGRKSLAYTMVFRSKDRTLTDEDANRYHETIKAALRDQIKAEIRES